MPRTDSKPLTKTTLSCKAIFGSQAPKLIYTIRFSRNPEGMQQPHWRGMVRRNDTNHQMSISPDSPCGEYPNGQSRAVSTTRYDYFGRFPSVFGRGTPKSVSDGAGSVKNIHRYYIDNHDWFPIISERPRAKCPPCRAVGWLQTRNHWNLHFCDSRWPRQEDPCHTTLFHPARTPETQKWLSFSMQP